MYLCTEVDITNVVRIIVLNEKRMDPSHIANTKSIMYAWYNYNMCPQRYYLSHV